MSNTKKLISMKLKDAVFEPRKDLSYDVSSLTNVTINNGITSAFQNNSKIVIYKDVRNRNFEFSLRIKTPNFKTAPDRIWLIRGNTDTLDTDFLALWQPISNNARTLWIGWYKSGDLRYLVPKSDDLDTLSNNWYYFKFSKIDNIIKSSIYLDNGEIISEVNGATDKSINLTNWSIFRQIDNTNYLAENAQVDLKNSYFTVF